MISLEEAREKRDVSALQKHAVATDAAIADIKQTLRELTELVKEALPRDDKRNLK